MVEDRACKLPAVGDSMRSAPVGNGIDVAAGKILPTIVIRIAVVVGQVERVRGRESALAGIEPENAAVGDFIQGVAPGVVELQQ